MNTISLLLSAAGGLSLLGNAAADVTLPAVMYRSNAVYSLFEAAVADDAEVIAARLSEGVGVNLPDEQGNTALHLAAAANHADIVQLLLGAGADPLRKDAAGRIPSELTKDEACRMQLARAEALRVHEIELGESIIAHDLDAVHAAMRARINPSAFAGDGVNTFIMLAVRENQPEILAALLAAGADASCVSPVRGLSALHIAVAHGHADMIPTLLAAGADPLHMADNGATALHDAVWNGDKAAIAALIPAYKACNFTPPEGGQPSPVAMAISHERADVVAMFLKAGFDPNRRRASKRPEPETILHTAAKAGTPSIVTMLLEAGADKSARDRDGQTPADVAKPEVADLLR